MVLKSLDQLRSGLQDALTAGEDVAERLALAEIDAAIQTHLRGILIPSIIVAILFAAAEVAAAFIGDPETLRLTVTCILLLAGLYGAFALARGLIDILPVLVVWGATRIGPYELARLLLYELIHSRLRQAFPAKGGKPSIAGRVVRYALKFSGRPDSWDGLAFQLADKIAPRMVRHGVTQAILVLSPVLAAWAYYRFQVFPDIILAETGLGFWSAFVYPLGALSDTIFGTDFRNALIDT